MPDPGDELERSARPVPDADLPRLFATDPGLAWRLFLDRHADTILSHLRHLGFGYDEAMDRFVYVCEKLREDGFRRLRTIRYAGERGELTPWLRQVVRRLCINWAWSEEGRRRLLRPIARLPEREQLVFQLYKWLLAAGGLEAMARKNAEKAKLLYDAIDASGGYYRPHAKPGHRSQMNVTFRLPSEDLEKRFVSEATAGQLDGLKGHRSVSGIRASIYNAFPKTGVEMLVSFIKEFQKKNG